MKTTRNRIRTVLALAAVAVVPLALTTTSEAGLTEYDAAVSGETAKLTTPVVLNNNATAFDFGALSGDVTMEFILEGDPTAGPTGYIAHSGGSPGSSLRYEAWNNTGQVGFTRAGVADWTFTPGTSSPTTPTLLAYVWDEAADVMDLYVNGSFAGTRAGVSENFDMPTGAGSLGRNGEGMVGTIHRATTYNSKLDASTLLAHGQAFLGTAPPSGMTVTYDFDVAGDDGATIDGWTDVLGESFPGAVVFSSGGSNAGGRGTGGGGNGSGNQDSSHPNHIMRSPEFMLTAASSIDFQLAGGDRGGTPTNESDISAGTSSGGGYQGLALRRVSDGEYLLFDTRDGDGNGYQAQTAFDAAALAPIHAANPGEIFTLDWVDTYSGSWGFAMIDDVVLNNVLEPGADDIPEPATMALLSLAACALGGYVRRRRQV